MMHYNGGYKYQLKEPLTVPISIKPKRDIHTEYLSLTTDGLLTMKNGYAWDGPSGPTFDTETFMRGSLVHDALYQLMRGEYIAKSYRKEADAILRQICLEDGMSKLRAWWVWRSVRLFAHSALVIVVVGTLAAGCGIVRVKTDYGTLTSYRLLLNTAIDDVEIKSPAGVVVHLQGFGSTPQTQVISAAVEAAVRAAKTAK